MRTASDNRAEHFQTLDLCVCVCVCVWKNEKKTQPFIATAEFVGAISYDHIRRWKQNTIQRQGNFVPTRCGMTSNDIK
jgi:hypothetical protein